MNSLDRIRQRIRGWKGLGGVQAQNTLNNVCVKLSKDKLKKGMKIIQCFRDIREDR